MASPPLLIFDELVKPISGKDPAGAPVPYDLREKLEESRKEENPADYAPDDPMRPEKLKKADWPGVVRLAQSILTDKSKDLLTAARLTEGLTMEHGFAGLRDGLQLLHRLVEQCWDRLYPKIEDGDSEVRVGPFNWLDDPDKGARFPNTLRRVPIVISENGGYGWLDWRRSQEGKGTVTRDAFETALSAMPLERCQTTAEDLQECQNELTQLTNLLSAKIGEHSPAFTGMKAAVGECSQLMQFILQRKGVATAQGPADAAGGETDMKGGTMLSGQAAANRAEAYRQLAHAAAVLQQLEPHSPIPYLIQRAIQLGAMPFPQLIKELVRDQNILGELSREFGIKQETPQEGG